MKYRSFLPIKVLILCLTFYGCVDHLSDEFFAGKTENVFHSVLNPALVLPFGNNIDSIDLNGDSDYELFVGTLGVPGETGFIVLPAVRGTRELNILLGGKKNMPLALPKGTIIRMNDKWSSSDTLLALYYYPGLHSEPIGYWKDQEDKYLGFRYKNKLGWVMLTTKVNAQLNQCLIVKEFGIEE